MGGNEVVASCTAFFLWDWDENNIGSSSKNFKAFKRLRVLHHAVDKIPKVQVSQDVIRKYGKLRQMDSDNFITFPQRSGFLLIIHIEQRESFAMVKTCQRISETLGKFIDDSLLLTIDF